MITRFAPSPTGLLHLGHAFAAWVAHDLARHHHGTFLLRFEDIDHTRVRPEFYSAIEEDLHWLGITWDSTPLRQSSPERSACYANALAELIDIGAAYPCFCTRKSIELELANLTQAPHGPEGPLYPGTCRHLPASQRAELIAAGTPHCWRLHAATAATLAGQLTFTDLIHGRQRVIPTLLGDVILARKDIGTSYHLAVSIDDAAQHVTHVTRGEDLLHATHVHRLIQAILHLPQPLYLHHPLVRDSAGQRLAKRNLPLALASLRASGASPDSIRALLPAIPTIHA